MVTLDATSSVTASGVTDLSVWVTSRWALPIGSVRSAVMVEAEPGLNLDHIAYCGLSIIGAVVGLAIGPVVGMVVGAIGSAARRPA